MSLLDYAFGIAVVSWLGSMVQFAIVISSSVRRHLREARP